MRNLKKFFLVVSFMALLLVVPFGVMAATEPQDVYRAQLHKDGSISCSGADDTSRGGGRAVLMVQPGKVHFTVRLNNAQPNTAYTLAVSEEPNCANPQFYPSVTTDANGDATFYGTYNTTSGAKNLLINASTTASVSKPWLREIGTADVNVVVP